MFRKVKVPELESGRILLRSWSRKDAEDLFRYASDQRVGPAAGWAPHRSVGESRVIIDEVYLARLDWAIVDKRTGRPIGNIGLDEDTIRQKVNSKELGYSLSADYWGQGIVPEAAGLVLDYAFRTLGLDCVTVRIETDNEASKRVADKCGFQFEGVLRYSYKRYDKTIVDMAYYSMLASDYFGNEEGQENVTEAEEA